MASLYGNPTMIERLLKAGADAKERGPNGETTVMFAARNGNPEAIKVLVAAGADVNAKEKHARHDGPDVGRARGHPAAVKALVELGADVQREIRPCGLPRNHTRRPINVDAVAAAGAATPRRGGGRANLSRNSSQFEQVERHRSSAPVAGFGAGQPDGERRGGGRGGRRPRPGRGAGGRPGCAVRAAARRGAARRLQRARR